MLDWRLSELVRSVPEVCVLLLTACAGGQILDDPSDGMLTDLPQDIARQELVLRHIEEQSEASKNRRASAPKLVEGMKALLKAVERYEQRAEELKQVMLVRCVREKRMAQQELIELAEQALDKLDLKAKIGDDESVEYEYSRVAVASQRARGVAAQLASCQADDGPHTGPTEVEVEIAE